MFRMPPFLSSRNATPSASSSHRPTASIGESGFLSPTPPNELRRSQSTSVASQLALRGVRRLEARKTMEHSHFLTQKARAANLSPPVDLRMLDYVAKYDENLVCPICRCPFVDPVVLTECDHCFCRDCIRQTWSTYTPLGPRGDCPTCRTPAKLGPRSATSKILVNILDDLEVMCPHHDDGCRSQVKRGEVQDHVSLYCGHGLIECLSDDCELPVLRKDSMEGCSHYPVSCLNCQQSMLKSTLEQHWRKECRDRKIYCDMCKSAVLHRDMDEHKQQLCPAISVPCPGKEYGCNSRSKRTQADIHAKGCALAKLAPILNAQKQRLDEQETAQRQMSRKLEVLEDGFANMQKLLGCRPEDADAVVDQDTLNSTQRDVDTSMELDEIDLSGRFLNNASPSPSPPRETFLESPPMRSRRVMPVEMNSRSSRQPVDSQHIDMPGTWLADFDPVAPLPPPATNGPYVSPLHHLLSMHESLRDEVTRMNSILQELDGRHSMQILNENLRTREEIAYFGGQIAGINRQVHWLTSTQLQRQQGGRGGPSSSAAAGDMSDIAGAGAGVEAAVNAVTTAASALRGAARMVSAGREGSAAGRGTSEEGRTKL